MIDQGHAQAPNAFMSFRPPSFLALILIWLLTVVGARAQDPQRAEYYIKAAFVFNFAKFVEWPPTAFPNTSSPIVIGILGENPFQDELEQTIRDKTLNNRPLVIKQFASLGESTNCHILFISTSEKKRLPEIFEAVRGTSVLTVGETDRFIETGGMVNLVHEGSKIRFQINEPVAKSAGLKISSKMLSLASPLAH